MRENGVPYAAFGLLWRAFGAQLLMRGCSAEDAAREAGHFDEVFVQPLDLDDNTGCGNDVASVIGSFNPTWDSSLSADEQYFKAVAFAEVILRNKLEEIWAVCRASGIVREALKQMENRVVVLDRYCPWKGVLAHSEAQFVVYPSQRGGLAPKWCPAEQTVSLKSIFRLHGQEKVRRSCRSSPASPPFASATTAVSLSHATSSMMPSLPAAWRSALARKNRKDENPWVCFQNSTRKANRKKSPLKSAANRSSLHLMRVPSRLNLNSSNRIFTLICDRLTRPPTSVPFHAATKIFFVEDTGSSFRVVQQSAVPQSVGALGLLNIAVQNLVKNVKFEVRATKFGGYAFVGNPNHISSFILIKSLWKELAKRVNDNLIIAIPVREAMIFIPEKKRMNSFRSLPRRVWP